MTDIDLRESRQVNLRESKDATDYGSDGKFTFAPKMKIEDAVEHVVSFGGPSALEG